jgi:hypothetical protein
MKGWMIRCLGAFAVMVLSASGQEATVAEFSDASVADAAREAGRAEIVIGFVGGFVKRDDMRHPEVQLAERLRKLDRYGVHADVFANHQGKEAFHSIVRLLDVDHDGLLSDTEKRRARIIIYGHSWGGSETVMLARELNHEDIPVLLTIQVDSIRKPGEEDAAIPANVKRAINFYQTHGPLHGRREIRAVDPMKTTILGNLRMTYEDHPVNCKGYPWLARTFTRPHIEIENDPRVWSQISSLIDEELPAVNSIARAASH